MTGFRVWRWVRIGLAAGAVLCLVLAAATPGRRVGEPRPGTPAAVNALDDERPLARSNEAPSLLVDRGSDNIVYLSQVELASGTCRFYVSLDRGATWTQEEAPRLDPYTQDCGLGTGLPQGIRTELRQAPDGTLYYVFTANDPAAGGSRSLLLARSTDGGRSWRTVVVAPGPKADDPEDVIANFQGHVAIDPDRPNRVYVTWRRAVPRVDPTAPFRPSRPFIAVSDDGGSSFAPPTQMLDVNLGSDGPRPLVVDGRLYAFFQEARPPLPASSPDPSPTPSQTRLFAAVSDDQGRSWTRAEIAAARDLSEAAPLYDPERELFYAVWHDNRREELDVYFATSRDGLSWSEPRLLNDDPRETRVGQYYPQISLSPDGRLDVAWYDFRDDPFAAPSVGVGNTLSLFTNRGRMGSVYLTSSSDGGQTWTKNVKVNDVPIDRTIGTWANNYDVMTPPAIASSKGRAVVAWSDTRLGTAETQTQDVYTNTVSFARPGTARITALQAAAVGLLFGAGVAVWAVVLVLRRQESPPPEVRAPVRRPARVPSRR